jgi:hypothetical protein
MSAKLEKSTYVERSAAAGTILVHQSLNQRRAITLCWSAKSVKRPTSTASATPSGAVAGPSRLCGTPKLPTNPAA